MKIVSSLLILGVLLYGCADNPAPRENATTVIVPPSSGTTTVVVPHESGAAVLCRDGTRPPCY
jgi:PBP1b-binding outer membrane lipoprotein LpoB